MQEAEEFRSFSNACEQFLQMKNKPLTKKEARIIEHYSMEILAKVAPYYLPNQPPQSPT